MNISVFRIFTGHAGLACILSHSNAVLRPATSANRVQCQKKIDIGNSPYSVCPKNMLTMSNIMLNLALDWSETLLIECIVYT